MALLQRKNLLITGLPGVGKTTLIRQLAEALEPFRPAGFYTREIRKGGERMGFEIVSLDGRQGLLSHVDIRSSFRVGKYGVDVDGFESFLEALPFLGPAIRLIIVDEIGKMECLSERFRRLLGEVLDSEKLVIATVALKGTGFIEQVKVRKDVKIFELSAKNRNRLFTEVLEEVTVGLR